MKRMLILGILLAAVLVGCGMKPVTSYQTEILTCPPKPPPVSCPAWPSMVVVEPEDLVEAFNLGRAAYAQCRGAVETWETAWTECKED